MMQNDVRVVVITGSIGTGKSTAVNILKDLGYRVLDSDKIVHDGYNKGEVLYHKVVGHFGHEILNEDESINRQKLGKIVFNDDERLIELNKIVHVYVTEKLAEGIKGCRDEIIFLDIPLILEKLKQEKAYNLKYDEIWLIYVKPEIQMMRLRQRAIMENKNPDEVLNIINKQIPIDEKAAMSDEVIDNDGTVEELELKIKKLLEIKLGR